MTRRTENEGSHFEMMAELAAAGLVCGQKKRRGGVVPTLVAVGVVRVRGGLEEEGEKRGGLERCSG